MKLQLRDVIKSRQQHDDQFARQQIIGVGNIVKRDGTVEVSGILNHVWVLPNGEGEPVAVFNREVKTSRPGLKVVYGHRPFSTVLEILWYDAESIAGFEDVAGLNTQNHAPSHQPEGDDPFWVTRRSFIDSLYVSPGVGVTVDVSPFVYDVSGVRTAFLGKTNYALTKPSAGLTWWELVYLDKTTNTIDSVTGTAVPEVLVPTRPNTPADGEAAAYVLLTNSITQVMEDDIDDGRRFLGGTGTATDMNLALVFIGW